MPGTGKHRETDRAWRSLLYNQHRTVSYLSTQLCRTSKAMLSCCACPRGIAGELREKLSSKRKPKTSSSTHQVQVKAEGKKANK